MAKNYRQIAAGAALAGAGLLIRWFSTRGSADEEFEEDPGLATLGEVEDAILEVEGFRVSFTHSSGRNARSNKRGFPPYQYQKKLNDDFSVKAYLKRRISYTYGSLLEEHGMTAVVEYADGAKVMGGAHLVTVRDSYK